MDLVAFFTSIFSSCTSWFNSLFSASGMEQWLFAAIGVIMAIRFFIMPLFGGIFRAASDTASERFHKDKEE